MYGHARYPQRVLKKGKKILITVNTTKPPTRNNNAPFSIANLVTSRGGAPPAGYHLPHVRNTTTTRPDQEKVILDFSSSHFKFCRRKTIFFSSSLHRCSFVVSYSLRSQIKYTAFRTMDLIWIVPNIATPRIRKLLFGSFSSSNLRSVRTRLKQPTQCKLDLYFLFLLRGQALWVFLLWLHCW